MTQWRTSGPKDRTPGLPGSDKNAILCLFRSICFKWSNSFCELRFIISKILKIDVTCLLSFIYIYWVNWCCHKYIRGRSQIYIRVQSWFTRNLCHRERALNLSYKSLQFKFKLSRNIKMLVRSCFLITLIKCLKGHKSLGWLFDVKK